MATIEDITVEQYSVFDHVFIYCRPLAANPDEPDPAAPVDVTGWTAKLQVRDAQAGSVLWSASTEDGRITVGGADGRFRVTVPGTVTSGMTRDGVYDLLATPPSGSPERVAQGSAFASLGVTVPPT